MAKCEKCGQEMLDPNTTSCTCSHIMIDGAWYLRDTTRYDVNERCHDCAIQNRQGNYHHFHCDVERCPVCGGQLLSCILDRKHNIGEYGRPQGSSADGNIVSCDICGARVNVVKGIKTICTACGERVNLYFSYARQKHVRELIDEQCECIKAYAGELCCDMHSDFLAVGESVESGLMEFDDPDRKWAAHFIKYCADFYNDLELWKVYGPFPESEGGGD